jgi:hypothetical protein
MKTFSVIVYLVVSVVVFQIAFNANLYEWGLAQVGTSVNVPPNPVNTLMKKLMEREADLNERERQIAQREVEVLAPKPELGFDFNTMRVIYFVLIEGLILLTLILLNFYLDLKRSRKYSSLR